MQIRKFHHLKEHAKYSSLETLLRVRESLVLLIATFMNHIAKKKML